MDNSLADAARDLYAYNLYETVRRNYNEANKGYLQKQIKIASEHLTEDQKKNLRKMGYDI